MELFGVLKVMEMLCVLNGIKPFFEVFELDLFDVVFGMELLGVLI
jgi:hypothetical protein